MSTESLNCTRCGDRIEPGEKRRTDNQGTAHETCLISIKDGWQFACMDCGFRSDAIPTIRECPECGSARTKSEPKDWTPDNDEPVFVVPGQDVFHREERCGRLSKAKRDVLPVRLADAHEQGLEPCMACAPSTKY